MSPTKPTTVRIGEPAACRTCLPIGSSPGQSRFAILCVTTATFGEPSRSASVNPLPRRMGSPYRLEVLGPDEILPHPRIGRTLALRLSRSHEPGHENVGPQKRWNCDRRRLLDGGNGAEPPHHLVVELKGPAVHTFTKSVGRDRARLGWFTSARSNPFVPGHRNPKDRQVAGGKTHIQSRETGKTPHEETSSGQHDECKRDLRSDERPPNGAQPPPLGSGAGIGMEL